MAGTRTGASRKPVTFRLRSDLIRLVEAVADREQIDRSRVIEAWVEQQVEKEFPGAVRGAA